MFVVQLQVKGGNKSNIKHGQKILAIGQDGAVVGSLVDITDYDLAIQPNTDGVVGKATFAANMQDGTVVVDRQKVLSIASS